MRFLCSTFGSSGDVFPMFGLAMELRQRGHDVTFATNEHYRPLAARHGLPFEPLGTEEQFRQCISHPDLWHPRKSFRHVYRSMEPALARQFELYATHARSPDAVGVTNCFGFGALLAQEQTGLPVITLHLQPAVLWSDHQPPHLAGMSGPRWLKSLLFRLGERLFVDPVVCPALNTWRRSLGMPPVRKITRWWNSPRGVLALFPEWYAPRQPDWPANFVQTDFPLWNDGSDRELAHDVDAFLNAGEPPIVFTPGSTNIHSRRFFEAAVDACQRLNRRGILLTEFPDQLPSRLPESVKHFNYVPLDRLLPHSAAFVHHGGIGSTSQGLQAGIPQILMPLAHDQFDNAAHVARLGVGSSIVARRFTGSRLAESLQQWLQAPQMSDRCRQVASQMTRDGLPRAATALEQVDRTRAIWP